MKICPSFPVLLLLAPIFGSTASLLRLRHADSTGHEVHSGADHGHAHSATGCSNGVSFGNARYVPSDLESSWFKAIEAKEEGCAWIMSSIPLMAEWLSTIQKRDNLLYSMASSFLPKVPKRKEGALHGLNGKVFSKFVLSNTCPGELANVTVDLYVEPLVGHLRHPYGLEQCVEAGKSAVHIMDLSYQLINPWPAADFHLAYPGKKYLLDCGTSTFGTSLQYLTTRYRQAGISFDEIWAWEVVDTNPMQYWSSVPGVFRQRMHFYNTPISSDFADPSHPLSIIRSVYRQGDFIAIKLDVDNPVLENAIMAEIDADPGLITAIGEMFYEMHYDHPEMAVHFGTNNGHTLEDVTATFGRLRAKGLLLHYWP